VPEGAILRRSLLVGTLACGTAAVHRAAGMGSTPPGVGSLPIPPSHALAFRLIRHGDDIGKHTLAFQVSGDTVVIEIAVDVLYKFGPIPLIHYTHRTTEVWRNGRLASLDAYTDKNGGELRMSARRVAAGLQVQGSGAQPYIAPDNALPTTYWNFRLLRGPMIGTQDGMLVHPKVTEKPIEQVRLASGLEAAARCYSLSGDLDLDLWYDAEANWMSMRFTVADGSEIKYERL
jgi:hypothetical protein